MDNLTHSLVGVALSRLFFKNRMAFATTALVIAANAPDLDLLTGWRGIHYIEYHRGLAHSLLALPVWALLLAGGVRWLARHYKKPVPPWWMALLASALGVASHLLLDLTNSYGIRLLAPFSQHWYALDITPIIDPWLWLLLVVCLGFPMLLGLIGNEVGARRHPHRFSAALALIFFTAFTGLRAVEHRHALAQLASPYITSFFDGQTPRDWAAFPVINTPLRWQAVVDLPANYLVASVDTPLDSAAGTFTLERSYRKPPLTPAMRNAFATPTARAFLQFARFPLSDSSLEGNQTRVTITDLRFADGPKRPGMAVEILLDPQLHVVQQSFHWQ